jgi:hypothetical protein
MAECELNALSIPRLLHVIKVLLLVLIAVLNRDAGGT